MSVEHLADMVRRLRSEGRKRGTIGSYKFKMYDNHVTFEHPEHTKIVEARPVTPKRKKRKR